MVLIGLRDNLHILRKITVRVREAHLFNANTLPCLGIQFRLLVYQLYWFESHQISPIFLKFASHSVVLCWNLICFRERVPAPKKENGSHNQDIENRSTASLATTLESPPTSQHEGSDYRNGTSQTGYSARSLLKSASISASKCIGVKQTNKSEVKIKKH